MIKQRFFEHFDVLNSRINLHSDAVDVVLKTAEWVFAISGAKELCDAITDAMIANEPFQYKRVTDAADTLGIDADAFGLFLCVYHSYTTRELYEKRGYPENVYFDTMSEIRIWAECCYKRTGKWGIDSHYGSVCSVLRAGRFRLGRFLFERGGAGVVEPYNLNGRIIKTHDPVIQIHIPEGDSITKEKRMDAYRRAYKFFGQTGHATFQCASWLFFKEHRNILPKSSNILDFMDDFEYYYYDEYTTPRNMWRIFGWFDSYDDISVLPQNSSLQKAYAKWWDEHHTTGAAWGLFDFDGENIIRKGKTV